MGKQDKIRGVGVRALSIYRSIQKIKDDALNQATKETHGLFDKLAKEKNLDQETLKVLQDVYLYKKSETMEDRINQTVDSFKSELRANKNDEINTLLLTFSAEGDLCRKPKEKYCYQMQKAGLRMNIVRYLVGQNNFISGKIIAYEMGTTHGSIANAINRINSTSKQRLNLPEKEDLIISRDRGGYKLNPLYPITQVL